MHRPPAEKEKMQTTIFLEGVGIKDGRVVPVETKETETDKPIPAGQPETAQVATLKLIDDYAIQSIIGIYMVMYKTMESGTVSSRMSAIVSATGIVMKLMRGYINDCWTLYHERTDTFVVDSINAIIAVGYLKDPACIFDVIVQDIKWLHHCFTVSKEAFGAFDLLHCTHPSDAKSCDPDELPASLQDISLFFCEEKEGRPYEACSPSCNSKPYAPEEPFITD